MAQVPVVVIDVSTRGQFLAQLVSDLMEQFKGQFSLRMKPEHGGWWSSGGQVAWIYAFHRLIVASGGRPFTNKQSQTVFTLGYLQAT